MENETIRILGMLEEGKISSEEAVQLIEALKHEATGKPENGQYGEETRKGVDLGFEWDDLSNLGRHLKSHFRPKAEFGEDKDWSFDAHGISGIDVENINGSIAVTGSEGDLIDVKAKKVVRAPSDTLAEEIAEHVKTIAERVEGERLLISTEQPRMLLHATARVNYDIRCPSNMNINLLAKNGKIDVKEIQGVLKLATINGKIRLESIGGSVNAKTTNGGIHASLNDLKDDLKLSALNGSIESHISSGNAPIALKTMNGVIRLILPDDFSGKVDAKTAHGKIRSDFPIVTKHFGRRHLTGQIGSDRETPIYLRAKNGSIHLLRSKI